MPHTPASRLRAAIKRDTFRAQWFADNGPCRNCGSAENLQAHHRNPAEKIGHNVWTWTKERREAELAKCDVLCRACHWEWHAEPLRRHGTYKRYRRGCRCELCRAARLSKSRQMNAKRGTTRRTPETLGPREKRPTAGTHGYRDKIVITEAEMLQERGAMRVTVPTR